jgi:hypothetical protein
VNRDVVRLAEARDLIASTNELSLQIIAVQWASRLPENLNGLTMHALTRRLASAYNQCPSFDRSGVAKGGEQILEQYAPFLELRLQLKEWFDSALHGSQLPVQFVEPHFDLIWGGPSVWHGLIASRLAMTLSTSYGS